MRWMLGAALLAGCSGGAGTLQDTGLAVDTQPTSSVPDTESEPEPGESGEADTDADGDGLSDAEEAELGTDPELADSDADGQEDGDEALAGTDPLNPYSRSYAGGYNLGDCAFDELPTGGGPDGTTYAVGDVVANFSMPDQYGETVDLYSFCGRTVLLTFGATWCESCRYDAEKKQALMDEFAADGLQVFEVLIDISADSELAAQWAEAYGLDTVAVLADPESAADPEYYRWETDDYIPSNYIIGPDLSVIAVEVFNPDPADWIE